MNLVFVHGRAQQGKYANDLKDLWTRALRAGAQKAGRTLPADLNIAFPYYGDLLDDLVRQLNAPAVDEVLSRGADETDAEEVAFREALLHEIARQAGITDAEIQAQMELVPEERGPLNWRWVHAIARALDRTPLGGQTLDRFTRDVYVYLHHPAVRRRIDRLVADSFTGGPTVVVAHSLGTVVAYNVLRDAARLTGPGLTVPVFVTLGSPLGIGSIRGALTPLAMPAVARRWFNARDPRDIVPLYPLDHDHFPIDPAIEDDSQVSNAGDDAHSISEYLVHPRAVERIVDGLAG